MSLAPDQQEARQEDIVDNVLEESLVHVTFPADDDAEFDGENLVLGSQLAVAWVPWTRIPRAVHVEDGPVAKAGIEEGAWLRTIDGVPSENLTSEEVAAALRRGASLGFNSMPPQHPQATLSTLAGKAASEALGGCEEEVECKVATEVELDLLREEADVMVFVKHDPASAQSPVRCSCAGYKAASRSKSRERETATMHEEQGSLPQSDPAQSEQRQSEARQMEAPQSEAPQCELRKSDCERTNDKKQKKEKKDKKEKKEKKEKKDKKMKRIRLEPNDHFEQENSQARSSQPLGHDSKRAALIDRGLSLAEIPPSPPPDYRKNRNSPQSHASHNHDHERIKQAVRLLPREQARDKKARDIERRTKRRRRDVQKEPRRDVQKDGSRSAVGPTQDEANCMNSCHEAAAEIQDRGSREELEQACQADPLPCIHDSQEGDSVDSAVERDQLTVPFEVSTSSAPVKERRQPQEGSERSDSHSKEAESKLVCLDDSQPSKEEDLARNLFGEKPLYKIIRELDEGQQAHLLECNVLQALQGYGKIRRIPLRQWPSVSEPEKCDCIWVGYFDRNAVSTRDVRAFFERCGPVRRVFKGDYWAHVHWEDSSARESVEAALRLSGELICLDPIRVECRDMKQWSFEEKDHRDRQQMLSRIAAERSPRQKMVGWTTPTYWQPPRPPPPVMPPTAASACLLVPRPPEPCLNVPPAPRHDSAWGPWAPPVWLRQSAAPSSSSTAAGQATAAYQQSLCRYQGPRAEPPAMQPPPGPPPAQQAAGVAYPAGMDMNGYWQFPALRENSESSYSDSYYSDESSSSVTSKRKKHSKHKKGRSKNGRTASQVAPQVPTVGSS